MKRAVDIRVTIGLVIAALMIGGVGLLFLSTTDSANQSNSWVTHTYAVLNAVNTLNSNYREAEVTERGFLLIADTGNAHAYSEAKSLTNSELSTIRSLTADNPAQRANLDYLQRLLQVRFDSLDVGIVIRRRDGLSDASVFVARQKSKPLTKEIETTVQKIVSAELGLLDIRRRQADQGVKTTRVVLIILISLAVLLIVGVYYLFRRDITQRVKAERERDRFFDVSPDLFFILDQNHFMIRTNPAWHTLLGWSAEELGKNSLIDFVHPDQRDELQRTLDDLRLPSEVAARLPSEVAAARSQIEFEGQFRRSDGSYCWLELRGRRFSEDGSTFANARDVTVRRQAEAEIRTVNERLRASNRELESFASIASHDLQEPLRKIQSFADILMTRYSEGLEGPVKEYLTKMQLSATRMRLLIDNMLGYSRLTGRAQQIEKVELRTVIKIVLGDLANMIESKGAWIEVEDLPSIDADKYQMHQLFQNLIGNSLKFQKPGAIPHITIRQISNGSPAPLSSASPAPLSSASPAPLPSASPAPLPSASPAPLPSAGVSGKSQFPLEGAARLPMSASAKSSPNVVLELSDNGIGFEQEYADKVFGMFQRLHGRQEYEGTGIGLAVCQKIVERHHGSITVRSRVNEGTTFEITLPKQQTNSEWEAPPTMPPLIELTHI